MYEAMEAITKVARRFQAAGERGTCPINFRRLSNGAKLLITAYLPVKNPNSDKFLIRHCPFEALRANEDEKGDGIAAT